MGLLIFVYGHEVCTLFRSLQSGQCHNDQLIILMLLCDGLRSYGTFPPIESCAYAD